MKLDDWNDLHLLLTIAREGTVTGAARALGVNQTTVTRRLKALQERLGVQLFERIRGGVLLSVQGEALVETAEEMERAVHRFERRAHGDELVGVLRLTVSEIFAYAWTEPLLAFARQHPSIELEIHTSDALHSLTRREADVALRITASPEEHLVGRRLGEMAIAAYAASSWDETPLTEIPWIGWERDGSSEMTLTLRQARRELGGAPFQMWANSYLLQLDLLRRGAGVSMLPCIVGDREPGLTRRGPPAPRHPVWALTHQDMRTSRRVRALLTYLGEMARESRAALLGQVEGEPETP